MSTGASRRPGPWELVGLPGDPVPADEWDVREVAHDLGRRGEALAETGDLLERLSRLEGWTGAAAETFVEHAAATVEDVRAVGRRYDGAAHAVRRYAEHVGDARDRTAAALRDAEAAEAARLRSVRAVDAETGAHDEATRLHAERTQAAALDDLALARRRLDAALDDLDAAARTAAEAIAAAGERPRASAAGARRSHELRDIAMATFDTVCTAVWGALDRLGAGLAEHRTSRGGLGTLVDLLATTAFLTGVVAGLVNGAWLTTFVLGAAALLPRTSPGPDGEPGGTEARSTDLGAALGDRARGLSLGPGTGVATADGPASPAAGLTARAVSVLASRSSTTTSSAWSARLLGGDAADTVSRLAALDHEQGVHRRVGTLMLGGLEAAGTGTDRTPDDLRDTVGLRPPVLIHR